MGTSLRLVVFSPRNDQDLCRAAGEASQGYHRQGAAPSTTQSQGHRLHHCRFSMARPLPKSLLICSDPHCSQPHSSLNRFKRANDRKSHLILNLLSWVDFLQPKYCCFENVKGFLKYSLNAAQDGQHKVKGGIEMGGLKFLVHALLAMK